MPGADYPFVPDDFTMPYTPGPTLGFPVTLAPPPPATDPAPRAFLVPELVDRRDLPVAVGFDFLKRVFSGF